MELRDIKVKHKIFIMLRRFYMVMLGVCWLRIKAQILKVCKQKVLSSAKFPVCKSLYQQTL
jgi:hypothetical protein